MTSPSILLSVPNVSEGRDQDKIEALTSSVTSGENASPPVRLLDLHSDADHNRSVLTLAGPPAELADALLGLAQAAVERLDVMSEQARAKAGQHPHIGSLDVLPIVYLDDARRGLACATALALGDRLGGDLGVPVFLYGELTADDGRKPRTRAELRRGGPPELARRMAAGELVPDFGPSTPHASSGATLLAARPPLVAFNVELASPATLADARRIAAAIREGGSHGLRGVRAIGVELDGGRAQVSMNVERPLETPLAEVTAAVAAEAPLASAELVGLAPRAALEGFPDDLPLTGFDPARHIIENALGC